MLYLCVLQVLRQMTDNVVELVTAVLISGEESPQEQSSQESTPSVIQVTKKDLTHLGTGGQRFPPRAVTEQD